MTLLFNPIDHPDAEVTRAYFCQLTGLSKISAYRHERIDPLWPKPVRRGARVFYKAIDCKRYLQSAQPGAVRRSLNAPPVCKRACNRA